MTKIEDFAAVATEANRKCVLDGLEGLRAEIRRIEISLTMGFRVQSRVEYFKNAQNALALAICADGRQSMVEDLRTNAGQLKEEPAGLERFRDALQEVLSDYGLDAAGTKPYTEEENEDTEDHDDPDDCDADPPVALPWHSAPRAVEKVADFKSTILPPEPTAEQKRQLDGFFRGFRIV